MDKLDLAHKIHDLQTQINILQYELLIKKDETFLQDNWYNNHLWENKNSPIAIFKSRKTAFIASLYFTKFICVGIKNIDSIKLDNIDCLIDRIVVFYPPLGEFTIWQNKAKELNNIVNIRLDTLLEEKASKEEKEQCLDVADFLIKFKLEEFHKNKTT